MYLALVLIAGFLAESLVWQERAPLPLPRAGYMAGVIDGHFVLAGGSYWTEKRKLWTDRVDIFDPQANVWRPAASLPEPRSDAACVTLKNSLYLFGGGAEGTTRRDALVFRNGEWKPRPAAQLPSPRIYAVAVASGSSIYLFGGLSKANDYHTANDTLWVWTGISFIALRRLQVYIRLPQSSPPSTGFLPEGRTGSQPPFYESQKLIAWASRTSFFRYLSIPVGYRNHFLGCRRLGYPEGSDSPSIRPSMLANSRRLRWLSANNNQ